MESNSVRKYWMLGLCLLSVSFVAVAKPSGVEKMFQASSELDLSRAVVVTPENLSARECKAVAMLLDEVQKRSRIRWAESHVWPTKDEPVVAVGSVSTLKSLASPLPSWGSAFPGSDKAEGFQLGVVDGQVVVVAGNDERGVLFGVGQLLRELRMTKDSVRVAKALDITTAPAYPLRGHQLGYRPKVNTYDAWTVSMYEQYIRDLAVFGTNAIELMPPRTDDAPDSPHFVMPQIEMITKVSQVADDYGIDVWLWYPVMNVRPDKRESVEFALNEWSDVFSKLPRVDAILVPSGDPGSLGPDDLLTFLAEASKGLHRAHPEAEVWVSTQSFNREKLGTFIDGIKAQPPAWLTGIVCGPQNSSTLRELREAVPEKYPIRHYPDITHSVQCQFPVSDWDLAYALTEQREVINPRPTDYAQIIREFDEYTVGALTYSEGVNDDSWDPDMPVIEVLRQFSRYFIGCDYEDAFAQGLLALERNWRGPLLGNQSVFTTLEQFQEMERNASPQVLLNWRFQQGLYRAYYDAYDARRLAYETELEQQAMDVLRQAPRLGTIRALDEAEKILNRAVLEPVAQDLRARVFELAEALYQSIHMQLSVPRYKAIHADRGANLDLIDIPLNNRLWLEARFAEIREKKSDRDRQRSIDAIVNWTNPGPGGFYDNLGNLMQQPHLVREPDTASDPEFRQAPLMASEYESDRRMSWSGYAETRYDSPLRLRYEDLDPSAQYKVRVVYSGDTTQIKIRLDANGEHEIHPYITRERPIKPVEFEIPREATRDGRLELAWRQEPGRGGNGRGCQVAEVWLIEKTK